MSWKQSIKHIWRLSISFYVTYESPCTCKHSNPISYHLSNGKISRCLLMAMFIEDVSFNHQLDLIYGIRSRLMNNSSHHDDVIRWRHFPRYWPFVRGIHRSPVNSPHKGQWRRALMFPFICFWINGWVNNREAGDLRRHRAHYDVIVISSSFIMHYDPQL